MKSYEYFDHTGDAGFYARGADAEALFRNAAAALMNIIAEINRVSPVCERNVYITESSLEGLLHLWLEELNYMSQINNEIYCKFKFSELKENSLRATVLGEPIDPSRQYISKEIKAVTYHQYWLKHSAEGWECKVIVDI